MMQKRRAEEEDIVVIPDPARDRYASTRLIPWWNQERLAAARVMVVGAGALGNEALKNLALLGVGQIVIVDLDQIEMSNLGRSVLYRPGDVGRRKAEVAAVRVSELNPDVRAIAICGDIQYAVGSGLLRRMDVVLGCLDNRAARWAVNQACLKVGVPWIDGGLDALSGSVKIYLPPDEPCYECGMNALDYRLMDQQLRQSCLDGQQLEPGRAPTAITSAAIIAGIQTQEALKLLHKKGSGSSPGFFYDGLGNRAYALNLTRRPDCPAHQPYGPIIELTTARVETTTLGDLLHEAQSQLGPNAYLSLDRELMIAVTCTTCQHTEQVIRLYQTRQPFVETCSICGEACYPILTHIIDGNSPILSATLKAAGIPPFDIVQARTLETVIGLELTGDGDDILAFARGGNKSDERN